ncbi:alpha/beta hydrolase [Streptomyces sp. NPDC006193]|uniref:alpha/beta fold hydrolase n=1 Tax=Streptomyces sp. NPDC006193 TaxID=3155717 RepID=UPI0033A5B4A9
MSTATAALAPLVPPSASGVCVPLHHSGLNYACRIVGGRPDGTLPASLTATTEPLMLLGGALQDVNSWPRLERRIADRTPLILVDLPGTGTADDLPAEQGFDTLAETAVHVLDHLRLRRVNLLGASYGAPIAYRIAQRHPERVARLLLAGTTRRVAAPMAALMMDMVRHLEAVATDDTDAPAGSWPGAEEYAARLVAALVNTGRQDSVRQSQAVRRLLSRQCLRITRRQALRNAACHRMLLGGDLLPSGGIRGVPALVFTGEHDNATTQEENREVAAAIEGSTLVFLREADHMAHLERDAEYADLVLRFLHDLPLHDLPYCTRPEHPSPAP